MENLLNCDGKKFTATISDHKTEGKITVEKERVYLCQNAIMGDACMDRKGYSYSWTVLTGDESDLRATSVADFALFDDTPQTFSVTGSELLLKAFFGELINMGYQKGGNVDNHSKYVCTTNIKYDKNSFHYVTGISDKPTVDVYFELPAQFNEALKFAQEQMTIHKELTVPKYDFKVGDYIKYDKHIGKITKLDGDYYTFWGFDLLHNYRDKLDFVFCHEYVKPSATEIKKFLLEVAELKGFKEGVKFHPIVETSKIPAASVYTVNAPKDITYYPKEDLLCGRGNIYVAGVWGEVISKTTTINLDNNQKAVITPLDKVSVDGYNVSAEDLEAIQKWIKSAPSVCGYTGKPTTFTFGCKSFTLTDFERVMSAFKGC